jgi:hypothetical protein
LSMPLIVREVELRWRFKLPCMHQWSLVQSLRGTLLARVLMNFANFPKYYTSSRRQWAYPPRK